MPGPKVAVVVVSVFNTLNTIDYRLTGGGHCCFFFFPSFLEGCCCRSRQREPPSDGATRCNFSLSCTFNSAINPKQISTGRIQKQARQPSDLRVIIFFFSFVRLRQRSL